MMIYFLCNDLTPKSGATVRRLCQKWKLSQQLYAKSSEKDIFMNENEAI